MAALGLVRLVVCASLVGGLLASAWSSPARADVVSAVDLLALHNQLRFAIGAPTIPADPRVSVAAQRHADYSSRNGVGGHFETAGLPGYSGYSPRDRVAAAGWSTTFVSEVAAGYSGALNAVRELWHAPYHRLGMMHPNAIATGWGHSDVNGRSTTVGDFVYDFGARPVEFVRSPAAGQADVPTSWSGNESPSPLPRGVSGPVGYPIMVVYSAGQSVTMRAAEIVRPDGSRVPIYYAPQQFEFDYQVIIPQQPLAAGASYHVRFDVNVNGRMVTNEWDFVTAGGTPAPPSRAGTFHASWVDQSPYPVLAPGATQSVTLRFRNSGTSTWLKGVPGAQANLGIVGDATTFAQLGMNVDWASGNRVAIQGEAAVGPGAIGTFSFGVRAPAQPGVYRIPLRPVIDGLTWMEDQGVFLVVFSDVGYHSAWIAQSPYPTLRPGEASARLSVAFKNTGTQPWIRGAFGRQANLGVNGDDRTWSSLGVGWPTPDRVAVQTEPVVAPGAVATFTFQIRAPLAAGAYAINLRPVVDGLTWMEDDGVYLIVTVR